MLIISASEVRRLLPMADCIAVMDQAMRALSAGEAVTPARLVMPLESGEDYLFLMPGSAAGSAVYGAKLVSLHPGNPELGKATVQGFVTLFDRRDGSPLALLDGAVITARRTAAASALATRELARPDVRRLGMFGAGVLAADHLDAIASVRDIREVRVWARNPDKARRFAREQSARTGLDVTAVEDAAAAAACGVVTAVTNSPEPVLQGDWLMPGSHLNLVGAHDPAHREADTGAVAGAAIYVDSVAAALKESGDLLIPIREGAIGEHDIVGEIGQVLNGAVPGRIDREQRTLYKSLGNVTQDLYAAEYVYRRALNEGLGTAVDL